MGRPPDSVGAFVAIVAFAWCLACSGLGGGPRGGRAPSLPRDGGLTPLEERAAPRKARATPAADEEPPAEEAPTGVVIERPAVAGILRMDSESSVDLAGAAAGMERHDSAPTGSDLSGRSLTRGTSAESLDASLLRPTIIEAPSAPVQAPNVPKPAAKACLTNGVTELDASGGVRASGGLDVDQIRAAMKAIGRHALGCFPPDTEGRYTVTVEVTAGCDGRASDVTLLDAGGAPSGVAQCVANTIGYASFPAHGMPDGVTFQHPMTFSF